LRLGNNERVLLAQERACSPSTPYGLLGLPAAAVLDAATALVSAASTAATALDPYLPLRRPSCVRSSLHAATSPVLRTQQPSCRYDPL
jgi:hypothetical protein